MNGIEIFCVNLFIIRLSQKNDVYIFIIYKLYTRHALHTDSVKQWPLAEYYGRRCNNPKSYSHLNLIKADERNV